MWKIFVQNASVEKSQRQLDAFGKSVCFPSDASFWHSVNIIQGQQINAIETNERFSDQMFIFVVGVVSIIFRIHTNLCFVLTTNFLFKSIDRFRSNGQKSF